MLLYYKPSYFASRWFTLSSLLSLFFLTHVSFAQSSSPSRYAMARIWAQELTCLDSIARATHTKPSISRVDKLNPAVPGGDLYLATVAQGQVEQLPTLPIGGTMQELVTAIENQLPSSYKAEGTAATAARVFVTFIVDARGKVQGARVLEGHELPVNAAVLAAVSQLPQLVPGQVGGKKVPVKLTLPIMVKA
jgi:outer membrane biosynthesis protein TonB